MFYYSYRRMLEVFEAVTKRKWQNCYAMHIPNLFELKIPTKQEDVILTMVIEHQDGMFTFDEGRKTENMLHLLPTRKKGPHVREKRILTPLHKSSFGKLSLGEKVAMETEDEKPIRRFLCSFFCMREQGMPEAVSCLHLFLCVCVCVCVYPHPHPCLQPLDSCRSDVSRFAGNHDFVFSR
jgi:hypothetical protein